MWLLWILAFVVFAAATIVTDGAGTMAGLRDFSFARLDIQKQNLGLGRLLHFVALAYLIANTPILVRLAETFAGREIQRLGRQSLAIFAFGSLLGALGPGRAPYRRRAFLGRGRSLGNVLYDARRG